jgi:hypothetical protein
LRRLLLLLALCLGCNQQNFVQLVPVEVSADSTGAGGPAGFACRLDQNCNGTVCTPLLFERAADVVRSTGPGALGLNPDFGGPRAMGSAVVDLMTLSPGPSDSDPFVVLARCNNGPCVPILRQCFPIDLTSPRDAVDKDGPAANGVVLNDIFDQLHQSGALVSPDAPDDEVLVRMVTTTLSCDQIAQRPLRFSEWPADDSTKWGESIFGCGYAGPLHLDSAHGAVFLGLPTLDTMNCVQQAAVCAADFVPAQAQSLLGL